MNGNIYDGNFKNDLKEGNGTLNTAHYDIYTGQFIGDFPEGRGTYKYINGRTLDGFWQKGVFLK